MQHFLVRIIVKHNTFSSNNCFVDEKMLSLQGEYKQKLEAIHFKEAKTTKRYEKKGYRTIVQMEREH